MINKQDEKLNSIPIPEVKDGEITKFWDGF
jgi:hypothetical protein